MLDPAFAAACATIRPTEVAASLTHRAIHVFKVASVNAFKIDTIDLPVPSTNRAVLTFEAASPATKRAIDLYVFTRIDLVCNSPLHTCIAAANPAGVAIMAACALAYRTIDFIILRISIRSA